jgi:hypothetical protein
MLEPWTAVASAITDLSVGSVPLSNMDTYKLPLPQSLDTLSQIGSMTFCAVSSRPVTLKKLPKDTLSELVGTLLKTIHRDFQTCNSPENFLVREPQMVETDTGVQKVILLGASNLNSCVDHFKMNGLEVVNLTTPGWIASPENILLLTEKLKEITCSSRDKIVLDLYGNMSYRFEQFDGTLSLPYKSGGRYHLAGKVVVCPATTFKKTLENTTSLFLAKKNANIIVVPPLPRYLFAGCCKQTEHCANVGLPDHPSKILGDAIVLRNCLKKFVSGLGLGNCRVLDTCCVTNCIPTANADIRIEALKTVTAKDGVHFHGIGYENLVKSIMQTPTKSAPEQQGSTTTGNTKIHYWRGFRSPVGVTASCHIRSPAIRGAHAHGGQHRGNRTRYHYHPYRKHNN